MSEEAGSTLGADDDVRHGNAVETMLLAPPPPPLPKGPPGPLALPKSLPPKGVYENPEIPENVECPERFELKIDEAPSGS